MLTTATKSRSREKRQAGPIGEYLTALGFCSEKAVRQAIDRQSELRVKGFPQRIGSILLDLGKLTEKELNHALHLQIIDRAACSLLFDRLAKETIEKILPRAAITHFAAGEIIYHQGDESLSVYIILQGRVNLVHQSEQGAETDFALLEAGEHFGEMSLLSDSSRFETTRAIERTETVVIPRDVFLELYKKHPEIFQTVISRWHTIMVDGKVTSQVIHDQYYKELISSKDPLLCIQLIGKSKHARRIRTEIKRISSAGRSALLIGKQGMRLVRLAQEIHENSPYRAGPFIIIDPDNIPQFIIQACLANKRSSFHEEFIHMATLFGFEQQPGQGVGLPWQGFLRTAHGGVLVIKGIEKFTPKVQRLLADYLKTGQFLPIFSTRSSHAATIVIAIADDDLSLEREILEGLAAFTLQPPPITSRKKDLKEMVLVLLRSIGGIRKKEISGIDNEALNVIMAYEWPGNFRELEEVIQRAVRLAQGENLTGDDIFFGKTPVNGKNTFNLLGFEAVRNFFQSPFYPKAPRAVIAVMFLFVILLGGLGNPSPDSNISLLLIWANWEPLLILSCLFLARLWCGFCPIGFFNDIFMQIRKKRWRIPERHLQKGFLVSALGLAVIFWSQAALDMWESPKATTGLLIAMLASAALFSLLFEGHVWCRYFCPLGQMVATFARTSIIEVRANQTYCSNQCHSYECYSGRGDISGCKLAKGPFTLTSNQNCNLCGNCIKLCPNESVRVNLRLPGRELINSDKADLALLLFVPMLWGTQIFRGLDMTPLPGMLEQAAGSRPLSYMLLMTGAAVFSYLLAASGWALARMSYEPETVEPTRFIFAMLPLVYAEEIAIRLAPLLNHAADFFIILGNQIGYDLPRIAFRLDLGSIHILQLLLVAIGLFFSIRVMNSSINQENGGTVPKKIITCLPLLAMTAISVILF